MRAPVLALVGLVLLAGCTAGPSDAPTPSASTAPPTVAAPPTAPTPSPTAPPASPVAVTPRAPPPRIVVENGTLEEVPINASTTYEIVFLLEAQDRVRVNLVFQELRRPAPYGWSGQVSLRAPDGRIVADSGTSMPESGAAFSLVLRDLGRTAEDGPGEFLARVHVSHPTSLTAKAYVDEDAGPPTAPG